MIIATGKRISRRSVDPRYHGPDSSQQRTQYNHASAVTSTVDSIKSACPSRSIFLPWSRVRRHRPYVLVGDRHPLSELFNQRLKPAGTTVMYIECMAHSLGLHSYQTTHISTSPLPCHRPPPTPTVRDKCTAFTIPAAPSLLPGTHLLSSGRPIKPLGATVSPGLILNGNR